MKVDLSGINQEAFGSSNAPELLDVSDGTLDRWLASLGPLRDASVEYVETSVQDEKPATPPRPRRPRPIRDWLFDLTVRIGPIGGMLIHEWLCYKLTGHAYEVVDVWEYAEGCTDITEVCIRCGHPSHR